MKVQKDPLSIEDILRLDGNELKIYLTLRDLGGDTRAVSFSELQKATRLDPYILQSVIEKLRSRRILYEPKMGHYSIPPFV